MAKRVSVWCILRPSAAFASVLPICTKVKVPARKFFKNNWKRVERIQTIQWKVEEGKQQKKRRKKSTLHSRCQMRNDRNCRQTKGAAHDEDQIK